MRKPSITKVRLTKRELNELSNIRSVAARAEFVAKCYISKKLDAPVFLPTSQGADFTIKIRGGKRDFEVKGTKDSSIALSKLKVSSTKSHTLISKDKITVLRVMMAHTTSPAIAELVCGTHFNLKQEPRWRATS